MSSDVLLEGLGYLASVLIAISLMMRSIVRLRWINLVGAACFTVYGILIQAYPVAALNFAIVIINLYFLWKTSRAKEAFSVVEMPADAEYVRAFLAFHAADIERFQPGFTFDPAARQHVLVVLRDLVPAGLVIARPTGGGRATMSLDFATPAYRDFKIGDYLYHHRADVFRGLGVHLLVSAPGNAAHIAYLERVGFRPADGVYRLDLNA